MTVPLFFIALCLFAAAIAIMAMGLRLRIEFRSLGYYAGAEVICWGSLALAVFVAVIGALALFGGI